MLIQNCNTHEAASAERPDSGPAAKCFASPDLLAFRGVGVVVDLLHKSLQAGLGDLAGVGREGRLVDLVRALYDVPLQRWQSSNGSVERLDTPRCPCSVKQQCVVEPLAGAHGVRQAGVISDVRCRCQDRVLHG